MSIRDQLAIQLALRTLWPLIVILPLEIVLVLLVVKRALRPVDVLSKSLAARSLDTLNPINMAAAIPAEVKPLVEALNDMLSRLARAMHKQHVFVADAAHELRTPLAAIKLQIQVARRDSANLSSGEVLQKLEERVNRAIHLVNQLLSLAREDAKSGAHTGCADLRRVGAQVVGELSILAEHTKVDLGLECLGFTASESSIFVVGDEASLITMVTNLVDNAIRYTNPGGRVDVRICEDGGGAMLAVVDDGPGIPSNDLERVLDRFYRVENANTQGSGLGLAIAVAVAAKHDAKLTLRNRADAHGLEAVVTGLRRISGNAVTEMLDLDGPITL
ncbi:MULTISPECIES: ATP-binding protein [unclassified Caballeronia]|uniref:ATP-binding protein n=1 Tax=unclassified Caballeronia TaxID=2646786 RepID=UPI002867033C|nr:MULTISPECIES: ATP-binding protein [unclassified Caballeronia]MDR5751310.1 ATP-binding protein [Caballeronia sp. LZ024]MDR5844552.1 ATP-binding protein [Caballeronia sp. LZ031]